MPWVLNPKYASGEYDSTYGQPDDYYIWQDPGTDQKQWTNDDWAWYQAKAYEQFKTTGNSAGLAQGYDPNKATGAQRMGYAADSPVVLNEQGAYRPTGTDANAAWGTGPIRDDMTQEEKDYITKNNAAQAAKRAGRSATTVKAATTKAAKTYSPTQYSWKNLDKMRRAQTRQTAKSMLSDMKKKWGWGK